MHGTPVGWLRQGTRRTEAQTGRRVLLPSGAIGDSMPASPERSRSCGRSQYQHKAICGSSGETAMYIVEFRHDGDDLAGPMTDIRTWLDHQRKRFPFIVDSQGHDLPPGIQSRERRGSVCASICWPGDRGRAQRRRGIRKPRRAQTGGRPCRGLGL
jgi:hypothetical protein